MTKQSIAQGMSRFDRKVAIAGSNPPKQSWVGGRAGAAISRKPNFLPRSRSKMPILEASASKIGPCASVEAFNSPLSLSL